jgi:hypothetical protein
MTLLLNKFKIVQLIIFVDSLEIVAGSPELKIKLYELNELVKQDEDTARYNVDYVMDWVDDYIGLENMKKVTIAVMDAFGTVSDVGKATALYLQKNL